jgi:hypothetical protein
VKSAEVVDLDNDRLRVEYHPTRATLQQLLQTVATQGFKASVAADPPAETP